MSDLASATLIATPHSHLFEDAELRAAIVAASDLVEIRRPEQAGRSGGPEIFHCELSLVAAWSDEERERLRRASGKGLRLVSFHAASRYQHNAIEGGAFQGRGEPYGRERLLANAAQNAAFARGLFGADIPLLVENNNDLGTSAYEIVTDADFLSELVRECGLGLLLDVSHALITAWNRRMEARDYLRRLPLEAVLQVHLARHEVRGGKALDAHGPLGPGDWDHFRGLRPELPALRYATIEFYKDGSILLAQLATLRSILQGA